MVGREGSVIGGSKVTRFMELSLASSKVGRKTWQGFLD